MIKFKEIYTNSYSNLLKDKESDNEYKIIFETKDKKITFKTKYELSLIEKKTQTNKNDGIELRELEWEY